MVIITAAEAKSIADEINLPVTKLVQNIGSDIVREAKRGRYTLDVLDKELVVVVDSYRHDPSDLQTKVVESLEKFGFKTSIIRESIQNETPGPVKDKQFIRVKW